MVEEGTAPFQTDPHAGSIQFHEDIIREITRYGDMDRPSGLVRRLALRPRVIKAAGIFLMGALRTFIT